MIRDQRWEGDMPLRNRYTPPHLEQRGRRGDGLNRFGDKSFLERADTGMFLFKDWYFLIKLTYHDVYSVDESEHMLQRLRKTVTQLLSLWLLLAPLRAPRSVRLYSSTLHSTCMHPHLWCLQRFRLCAVISPQDSCLIAQPCCEVGRIQRYPS